VLVPQGPALYGTLDEALEHRERYTRDVLLEQLQRAGLELVHLTEFNRTSVPAWWFNGRLLKRRRFSRVQLKVFDVGVPVVRRVDRFMPWRGQSLVAVGRKG
jgi:hypothetical protein